MKFPYHVFILMMAINIAIASLIMNALVSIDPKFSVSAYLFFSSVLQIFFIRMHEKSYDLVIAGISFCSFIYAVFCIYNFEVISGVDASRYYDFLLSYDNLSEIIQDSFFRTEQIHDSGIISGPGSYFIFGIPVHLFYLTMPDKNIFYIVAFNNICKVSLLFLVKHIASSFSSKQITLCMISVILASPLITYFANTMGKDMYIVMLTFLLCVTIMEFLKNPNVLLKSILFVGCLLLFTYCLLLRPYAPAMAVLYSLLFLGYNRCLRLCLYGTIAIMAFFILREVSILFNWIMITGYMFISPNPLQISSFSGFALLPSLSLIFSSIYFAVRMVSKKNIVIDNKLINTLIVIVIFSAILTLVGYYSVDNQDGEYALGSAGDAMLRKQLMIIPLVFFSVFLMLREKNDS